MKRIILFFTNKEVRGLIIQYWKLLFLSWGPVAYIAQAYNEYQWKKSGETSWDRYLRKQKEKAEVDEFCFACNLTRVWICLTGDDIDEETFKEAVRDTLSCATVEKPEYKELKEWLENATMQSDPDFVEEIINSLTSEEDN